MYVKKFAALIVLTLAYHPHDVLRLMSSGNQAVDVYVVLVIPFGSIPYHQNY